MEYNYNHLYVLGCDDGRYVKIGVCKSESNILSRIKNLQTGNPHKITLVWSEERPNATKAEKYLHRCFQDNSVSGEWFEEISLDDIRLKLMLFHDQV